MKNIKKLALYSVTSGIFIAIGFIFAFAIMPQPLAAIGDIGAAVVESNPILVNQELTYTSIYQSVAPSVVSISIQAQVEGEPQWLPVSTGSGFVVDAEGHIVTNNHVVDTAINIEEIVEEDAQARIEITMFDGTITSANIIGVDPDSDIAVIKVDVPQNRLHPVTFANSDELMEGQIVFALGNPFANDWTLTTGIISALNRSIPGLNLFQTGGVIQTDAAINPGNSGGPLVNINGQVIGVNSQINTESGSNSGIGFAVPGNLVIRVANSLISTGEMQYSYLGINTIPMGLSLSEVFDLPDNIRGVGILQVSPDTPASRAGLQSASDNGIDIITAINSRPISGFDELIGYLSINTAPGDTVIMTIYRNGEILQVPVTLASRPN